MIRWVNIVGPQVNTIAHKSGVRRNVNIMVQWSITTRNCFNIIVGPRSAAMARRLATPYVHRCDLKSYYSSNSFVTDSPLVLFPFF